MTNTIKEISEKILDNENIIFDENLIKEELKKEIANRLFTSEEIKRPFLFEQIIFDFFEYVNVPLIKTKKTRDSGIDGIIKINVKFLGEMNIGLQIKYKLIDSNDVDIFIASLKNAELQLGLIVCKESRELHKYSLNSKIKAILLSKGLAQEEDLIKDKISINPINILKLNDIIEMIALDIRNVARGIYKK